MQAQLSYQSKLPTISLRSLHSKNNPFLTLLETHKELKVMYCIATRLYRSSWITKLLVTKSDSIFHGNQCIYRISINCHRISINCNRISLNSHRISIYCDIKVYSINYLQIGRIICFWLSFVTENYDYVNDSQTNESGNLQWSCLGTMVYFIRNFLKAQELKMGIECPGSLMDIVLEY